VGPIGATLPPLLGRDRELRGLAALMRAARNGVSGSMVIRGDPGSGSQPC
jgi:5,10-methylenetetrahydrofolate reductase